MSSPSTSSSPASSSSSPNKGWTTKTLLEPTEEPYDETILTLRTREFANEALISHFWGQVARDEFVEIMDLICEIHAQLRFVNPEFDAVMRGEKDVCDPAVTDPIILPLKPMLADLEDRVSTLLHRLL